MGVAVAGGTGVERRERVHVFREEKHPVVYSKGELLIQESSNLNCKIFALKGWLLGNRI